MVRLHSFYLWCQQFVTLVGILELAWKFCVLSGTREQHHIFCLCSLFLRLGEAGKARPGELNPICLGYHLLCPRLDCQWGVGSPWGAETAPKLFKKAKLGPLVSIWTQKRVPTSTTPGLLLWNRKDLRLYSKEPHHVMFLCTVPWNSKIRGHLALPLPKHEREAPMALGLLLAVLLLVVESYSDLHLFPLPALNPASVD